MPPVDKSKYSVHSQAMTRQAKAFSQLLAVVTQNEIGMGYNSWEVVDTTTIRYTSRYIDPQGDEFVIRTEYRVYTDYVPTAESVAKWPEV